MTRVSVCNLETRVYVGAITRARLMPPSGYVNVPGNTRVLVKDSRPRVEVSCGSDKFVLAPARTLVSITGNQSIKVIYAPGNDGKTILNGSGVPALGLGVNGDFYIDTAGHYLYGPKAGGSWGSPVALTGPPGLLWRGTWQSSTYYYIGDAVSFSGSSYYAKLENRNKSPSNPEYSIYWGIIASAGGNGQDGTPGMNGFSVLSGIYPPTPEIGRNNEFYIDYSTYNIYGPKNVVWGEPHSLIGPQGATGITGPAGADGKTIFHGSGAPAAGLGTDGDIYIDTAASALYGPKSGGSWGSPVSLIGPTGSQGAQGVPGINGRTVLSGTGAPSPGLGSNMDFYIDTAASNIYGPKIGGAWGSPVSIKGRGVLNGNGVPSSGLGLDGDFYIDTTIFDMYGPKAGGAWGSPVRLVGNTLRHGVGVPSPDLGNDGDYYVDTAQNFVYGPKTGGSWGIPYPFGALDSPEITEDMTVPSGSLWGAIVPLENSLTVDTCTLTVEGELIIRWL